LIEPSRSDLQQVIDKSDDDGGQLPRAPTGVALASMRSRPAPLR
jgi:hypothetical protein